MYLTSIAILLNIWGNLPARRTRGSTVKFRPSSYCVEPSCLVHERQGDVTSNFEMLHQRQRPAARAISAELNMFFLQATLTPYYEQQIPYPQHEDTTRASPKREGPNLAQPSNDIMPFPPADDRILFPWRPPRTTVFTRFQPGIELDH